jgi:fructose-1-phosphate kinase PfkB-like protein
MTAGMIYGFTRNYDIIDTLKFSFAASAANASKWIIAKNKLSEIEAYIDKVVVEKL